MKRALILLAAIVTALTVAACRADRTGEYMEEGTVWFETVDKGTNYTIRRHRATGVCYIFSDDGHIEIMLNIDGRPYTLRG